jgi:voltage-gated potassium channel
MKFLPATLAYFLGNRSTQRNLRALLRFVAVLVAMMAAYTVIFHFIAAYEGQRHSWISGLYWTVVTMTTLGYGDIVFTSDLGRAFSSWVILSGVLFLLILLPFAFIQFFYAPWIEAQTQLRAPRRLPESTHGHVILTHYDAVATSLIPRLKTYNRPYVVIEPDVQRALELFDEGVRVMVGDLDDQHTYHNARVEHAALVVAGADDYLNTNIAFTVRELTERVPIVAKVREQSSVDIMQLAGATHVLHLAELLGRALARRTLGGHTRASEIGRFGELIISEAPVMGTPLVGKTIKQTRLREVTGLNIVGVWERGALEIPHPEMSINPHTVLVLAGSEAQFDAFDALVCIYNLEDAPVVILGGGRVGRAIATSLDEQEIPYRIVEQNAALIGEGDRYVHGSAADLDVLERAGIRAAPTAIVTTHDDATNIYLTIYCRKLRPDIQIVARATLDRNVSTLHRAGADFVMSYGSMGANAIFNVLEKGDIVMLAEGLNVFRYPIPPNLVGNALAGSRIRESSGCSVLAIELGSQTWLNPDPTTPLPEGGELILIGTNTSEQRFVEQFSR